MRILQITKKYPQIHGGDATAVSNLETQFRKRGHSVHILTVNCDLITPSEWVIRIGPRFSPEQLDTFSFRRVLLLVYLLLASFSLVKKTKPDLIHSHSADVGFMFSVAARLRGIPMVHTCHGLTYANREASILKRYGELFLLACSSFRRIIVVDKPSQVLLEKKGFSRVAYIPNGVDEEFFSYQMPPADRTQVVFLFLGRLEEQKGLDYLIEAVRLMKDFSNAFKVIIAGTGSLHDYLQERIQEANISDCVELKGRLETSVLPDLYSSADIFVLPSLWEGMPLTVLEAWSCGLPIIVTKVGIFLSSVFI